MTRQRLTIDIDSELKRRVKHAALDDGITIAQYVGLQLEQAMEERANGDRDQAQAR